jgi:hypothetical protein
MVSSSTTTRRSLLVLAAAVVAFDNNNIGVVHGYITSKSSYSPPTPRQIEFLKQITDDICASPTGELTESMIADSHHIMKGWTRLSKTTKTSAEASKKNNKKKDSKPTATVAFLTKKENAVAVESLVKRLVEETKAGNTKANPTTEDYNCMLESWARSDEGVFAAERCEQILTQMQSHYELTGECQPNLQSFKIALMAWKHAGGNTLSSFRAQRILEWMMTLAEKGQNDLAYPDQMCFDSVLQSWSRNTHKRSPEYAETLLGVMETKGGVRPRTLSFNAVLGAWGRAITPTTSSSTSTTNARAWERACDILSFMEKLYHVEGNKDVEPDRVSYHIVMSALARSGDPNAAPKADKILKFIEKRVKSGELSWKPDTLLFNSAMGCWAHSNAKDAYRKSRSILDRQIYHFNNGCGEQCRPDVYGFTSVLSTCAAESGSASSKAKAFNVALSTFQQLVQRQDEYGSPNHVTYGTMMKCVANLLPPGSPERKKWTEKIFRECIAKGMVGGMVLSRSREAVGSAEEYKELMMGHTKSNIPQKWTRNVNEKSEYRRRMPIGKRGEV